MASGSDHRRPTARSRAAASMPCRSVSPTTSAQVASRRVDPGVGRGRRWHARRRAGCDRGRRLRRRQHTDDRGAAHGRSPSQRGRGELWVGERASPCSAEAPSPLSDQTGRTQLNGVIESCYWGAQANALVIPVELDSRAHVAVVGTDQLQSSEAARQHRGRAAAAARVPLAGVVPLEMADTGIGDDRHRRRTPCSCRAGQGDSDRRCVAASRRALDRVRRATPTVRPADRPIPGGPDAS